MLANSDKILCLVRDQDTDLYIHMTTIDNFMKHKPPCQDCLIQGMCIKQDKDRVHNFIHMQICNKLREFIYEYNKDEK
jgi:hypothetical protein